MRARSFVAVVVSVLGLAIPFACGGSVAVPPTETKADTGPTTTTTPTTTGTGSPEACGRCVEAKCKATWEACVADAVCTAQTDCIAACTNADCQAACVAAHPSTTGDATEACFRGACAADCTR